MPYPDVSLEQLPEKRPVPYLTSQIAERSISALGKEIEEMGRKSQEDYMKLLNQEYKIT